jgi:hypothetical protein
MSTHEAQTLVARPGADEAVAHLDAWIGSRRTLARKVPIELTFDSDARWEAAATYSPNGVRATPHGLLATLQLTAFDEVDGEARICDIKQQEVIVVPAVALGNVDRFLMCLDGWADVLPKAFEQRFAAVFDTLMPHDLMPATLFTLKRPRSRADFAAALARRWKVDLTKEA